MFVVIEGIDGSGKTTLFKNLLEYANNSCDYPTKFVRAPGQTKAGSKIRDIVLGHDDLCSTAQLFLYLGDMVNTWEYQIEPYIKNHIVIADRWWLSTYTYQYENRSLLLQSIPYIGPIPDIVIYLDIPPEQAYQRVVSRGGDADRFESKGLEFMQQLHKRYEEVLSLSLLKDKVVRIDSTDPPEKVFNYAASEISQRYQIGSFKP